MGLFSKKEIKSKYSSGLEKPRRSLFDRLKLLFAKKVDEEYFEELEDILIGADVGAKLSIDLVSFVKEECKLHSITDSNSIMDILFNKIKEVYEDEEYDTSINLKEDGLSIILVMGVNGVGKTTSIAKMANNYKKNGKKVLLVAADTFRAGAVDQLNVWADRINCDIVSGELEADPSSVIYSGVSKAKEEGYDICLIDTAGRLQTKTNLMNEANKMYRVISKIVEDGPHESLLVLDATMGQNGVLQAKSFLETSNVSGIVLTKMDGTSKGGIILSIKQQLNIPVKFIGLGEGIDDLVEFDIDEYLNMLLKRGE